MVLEAHRIRVIGHRCPLRLLSSLLGMTLRLGTRRRWGYLRTRGCTGMEAGVRVRVGVGITPSHPSRPDLLLPTSRNYLFLIVDRATLPRSPINVLENLPSLAG